MAENNDNEYANGNGDGNKNNIADDEESKKGW